MTDTKETWTLVTTKHDVNSQQIFSMNQWWITQKIILNIPDVSFRIKKRQQLIETFHNYLNSSVFCLKYNSQDFNICIQWCYQKICYVLVDKALNEFENFHIWFPNWKTDGSILKNFILGDNENFPIIRSSIQIENMA